MKSTLADSRFHPARRFTLRFILLTLLALAAGPMDTAASGGFPNLSYTKEELGQHLAVVSSPKGHGSVAMHRGHLVVIYSRDAGRGDGAISFWDISNPRAPKQVSALDDSTRTSRIREPHGWGMSGDIACLQSTEGMQFWDFRDINAPKLLADLDIPEISISDYGGCWWTSWQGGYVYGGGGSQGLLIVDARDPSKPKHIKNFPRNKLGGINLQAVFAVGNRLYGSSNDFKGGLAVVDIGDPENPVLMASSGQGGGYASHFNGGRMYVTAKPSFLVFDMTGPSITRMGATVAIDDKGGYATVQDQYVFAGYSGKSFQKIDVGGSGPDFPIVLNGQPRARADQDFATVLGNLVFSGSDHAGGSTLIPHSASPDKTGPRVNFISPADNAANQPLTSRIGVTMTDLVEGSSLDISTFTVRPVGGQALPGRFATQTGIVNFSPDRPLSPNTTYEVEIKAGGIKDYAGNGVPTTFKSRFSTGAAAPVSLAKPRLEAAKGLTWERSWNGSALGAGPIFPYGKKVVRNMDARGRLLPTLLPSAQAAGHPDSHEAR